MDRFDGRDNIDGSAVDLAKVSEDFEETLPQGRLDAVDSVAISADFGVLSPQGKIERENLSADLGVEDDPFGVSEPRTVSDGGFTEKRGKLSCGLSGLAKASE